jgi:Tfp pilus assembly protein PilF
VLLSQARRRYLDHSWWRERAYRAAFLIAAAIMALSSLAGIVRSTLATRRLPSLAQDPLLEGRRLAALGSHRAARDEFQRALAVYPFDTSFTEEVGEALLSSGDPANALVVLARARAERPGSAHTHVRIGRALLVQGRLREAEDAFRMALSLDPQNAAALHGAAELLIDRDRYVEAIEMLQRAVSADPAQAGYHNSLGVALALAGRPREAAQAFDTAFRLAPSWGTANRDRALAAAREAGARP